jgi:ATP-binding cassette, subfamily B, bacterial
MRRVLPIAISTEHLTRSKDVIIVSYKLLKLIWQTDKWMLIAHLISVLIPAVVPFITAYIFKLIIDLVAASLSSSKPLDINNFLTLFAVLITSGYIQRLAFSFQSYADKVSHIKMPIQINQVVLNKIASLDMQYFENDEFHDLLQKVKENYSWRPQRLTGLILFLFQSLLQVSIALYAILKLNPFLAVLVLVVAIPDLVNQVLFSKFAWNVWDHKTPQRRHFGYAQSLLQEKESIKELKIFSVKDIFLKRIYDLQINFFNDNKKLADKQLKVNTIFNLMDSLVNFGVVGYVILQAASRKITLGDISFYQQVLSSFNGGVTGLFRNLAAVFEHTQYMKSIFDVLELEPLVKEIDKPVKVDFKTAPTIEFKDVSFRYPGTKRYVFRNFSLVINPGEKVAFVGENGAGKTTLIKLLARFYDVDEGEILIDGKNIKSLDLESWYRSIGVLFQDFIKYEYSVKDNIFFGKAWEKENLEAIIDAAKYAGAHEMIKKFENEYEQMLGKRFEGGVDISGGQWQKIALARAFFRSSPVLVLDEPTSAIDAKAEAEIFSQVEKLSKDKTVIIISHRFSTVRNADKIYVVEGGKIKESGNHKELMKLDGQYAELFNLQAKGYQ